MHNEQNRIHFKPFLFSTTTHSKNQGKEKEKGNSQVCMLSAYQHGGHRAL